ncbi:glycosyltransferase family 1 protein [Sphingomonas sp.]|uniref:glycosyltransferase family 4 protein n=1 Tax=Sphingomonas sp. TaxID=28214 RepID=UPI001810D2B5|nr:glycosyltransferase family 1 protein [Sphingomonas sp.]MBA3510376.1 glycosyltransferase family 1 protein [Sphingomonas sp.]
MQPSDLRIALVSGNYNYVRDGANQALNRLSDYLLRQGAQVRAYSPTVANPAFEANVEIVNIPSVPIPFRPEYRLPLALTRRARRDLAEYNPNIVHIASPDIVAHRAVSWARRRNIAAIASIHTRFDTYLSYYHLEVLEPAARAIMRRLYRRCDAIVVPAESTAAVMRAQRMNRDISIWTRGVDREQFHPGRRDMEWRRGLGIDDDALVIAFLGRVVMEKGLDLFADTMDVLAERKVRHRVLVIGDGPARPWFEQRMPNAIFTGEQVDDDLARAIASSDVLLNPSITETFGNVTLESMACGLPVVAAVATGATSLVRDGETGMLVEPGDEGAFADALEAYAKDPELRRRHGEAGLAYAQTMDWDQINSAVVRVYLRVIEKRARLTRMTRR